MLTIAAATDLAGPLIAKNIIDNHILGIESEWHETKSEKNTAEFQGKYYKKAQNFTSNEQKGEQIRILQIGAKFVVINQVLEFDGKRSFENGVLTVQKGTEKAEYPAKILTGAELKKFYQLEIPGIVKTADFIFWFVSRFSCFPVWTTLSASKISQSNHSKNARGCVWSNTETFHPIL